MITRQSQKKYFYLTNFNLFFNLIVYSIYRCKIDLLYLIAIVIIFRFINIFCHIWSRLRKLLKNRKNSYLNFDVLTRMHFL